MEPCGNLEQLTPSRKKRWGKALNNKRRLARGPSSGLKSPDQDHGKEPRSRWPDSLGRGWSGGGPGRAGQQQILTLAVVIGWT